MTLSRFVCHCTVNMFDVGCNAHTTARPTIVVTAKDENTAETKARDKLRKQYSDSQVRVKNVCVELIKKISKTEE